MLWHLKPSWKPLRELLGTLELCWPVHSPQWQQIISESTDPHTVGRKEDRTLENLSQMQLCLISAQPLQGWVPVSPWVHCHSPREHHKPPPSSQLGRSVHQPQSKMPEPASHPMQRGEKASWLQHPAGAQSLSCVWLCNPMDCSPPGCSVCEFLQARILEWVATSASRGSSHPRDRTCVSCITGRFSPDSSRKDPSRHLRVQSPCERAAAVSGRDPAASPRAPVSCSAI